MSEKFPPCDPVTSASLCPPAPSQHSRHIGGSPRRCTAARWFSAVYYRKSITFIALDVLCRIFTIKTRHFEFTVTGYLCLDQTAVVYKLSVERRCSITNRERGKVKVEESMRRSELQAEQPHPGISRKSSFDLSKKSDCQSKQISADDTVCGLSLM
ncbi:hypothetical protein E2C01_036286 [Portunus trituberculatus]|uniref:Uncharacterized protein n=1 Tax=Portunus trituberculatus TaxID=210409 RepID=A0A5B7FBN7_PORTR|nr:hypothetical protein [Portunus trituberculatus]